MKFIQETLLGRGVGTPLLTVAFAVGWLVVMLAYSPVADWLASRWAKRKPRLKVFQGIQQSKVKLAVGIVIAWVLGAFLEELVFRGIVLNGVERWLRVSHEIWISVSVAICVAALGAGFVHFYQGLWGVLIITQLSVLFGVLFVVSGHNLLTFMLCHGLYDTIAFIRFAQRKSKYSHLDELEGPNGRANNNKGR